MNATLRITTTEVTYVVDFSEPKIRDEYGRGVEITEARITVRGSDRPRIRFYGYALTKSGRRHGASTLDIRYTRDAELEHLALQAAGLAP